VARDAQQTEAYQTNRNLLLSDDAMAYSIPRLEIYADDVKCSHGSTTGQLDEDHIFYLRARGLDTEAARVMLAGAFAGEITTDIEPLSLRESLQAEIAGRLSGAALGGVDR
jgi:Fe-S cluster assembly protein SufD